MVEFILGIEYYINIKINKKRKGDMKMKRYEEMVVNRIVLGNRNEIGEIRINRKQEDYTCEDIVKCNNTKCENCIFDNDEIQPIQFIEILIDRAK